MINETEAKSVHEKVKATLSNCPVGYKASSIAIGPETLRLLRYHDWGRGITSYPVGKHDFYGVPLLVSDYMKEGEIRVSYVPDPPLSWTIQVVNNLTGDVIKAIKFNKQDAGDVTEVLLNVRLPGVQYQWDSWVTLP